VQVLHDHAFLGGFCFGGGKEGFADGERFAVFFICDDDEVTFVKFAFDVYNAWCHDVCTVTDVRDGSHIYDDFGQLLEDFCGLERRQNCFTCSEQDGFSVNEEDLRVVCFNGFDVGF